jgi:hypothetical protein
MPGSKQLSDRYGTCYRTLHAALQHLREQGLVESYRRGYRVTPLHVDQPMSSIVLVAPTVTFRGQGFWGPINGYDRQFEYECRSSGVRAGRMGFSWNENESGFIDPDTNEPIPEPLGDDHSTLGYLMVMISYAAGSAAALHRLAATGKPVAVLDMQGRYRREMHRPGSLVRVLSLADSYTGGLSVGRYLLDRGHSRVAFISQPSDDWALQRLDGVREAFREAGHPNGVAAVVGDMSEPEIRKAATFDRDFGRLRRAYHRWRGDHYDLLVNQFDFLFDVFYPNTFLNTVALRDFYNGLCDRVIADKGITAWIAPSDRNATWAMHYLHDHGVEVPRQIALISFDDSNAALSGGITSYSFNAESTVRNSIEHILRPSTFRSLERQIEVQGSVVERASTRR